MSDSTRPLQLPRKNTRPFFKSKEAAAEYVAAHPGTGNAWRLTTITRRVSFADSYVSMITEEYWVPVLRMSSSAPPPTSQTPRPAA